MKRNMKAFLFLLIVLISATLAEAAREAAVSSARIQAIGNYVEVKDNKYDFMLANPPQPGRAQSGYYLQFHNDEVKNYVLLKIDRHSLNYQAEAYTAEVKVLITTYPINGTAPVSQTKILKVNYSLASAFQDKHLIYISPAQYKMKVEVTNVTFNAGFSGTFPVNLKLEAGIESIRNYNFYGMAKLPPTFSIGHNSNLSSSGELEVYWDYRPGSATYELEWTYLEAYDSDGRFKDANEVSAGASVFTNNATRVEVSANHYSIPVIYDKGYIVYRVRGKNTNTRGNPVYTNWSFEEENVTLNLIDAHFKITDGHERNLNWQNSLSFAEEGKHKAVVSYYDGSLRNRQNVTKLNSQNETIVGEIIYDNEGRGVINVLPAPAGDDKVKYYPYFNLSESSTPNNKVPYDKHDFDKDDQCVTPTKGMSTLDGASRYYSPENPNADKGENAYLPDAEKKPFTQVEFTTDMTGRIKRQGIAGKDLGLGSNHETQYFYTTPSRDELDRLFGNEVGYSNHYKKTIKRDPNGQVSITYLDDNGNVVANSLSGENPANLDRLPSNAGSGDITESLIDQDGNISKNKRVGNSLTLTENIFVAKEGNRNLEYEMEGKNFSKNCEVGGSSVCFDCVLDLHIYLMNECGEKIDLNAQGLKDYITTIGSTSTGGCTSIPDHVMNDLRAISLPPGTYTVYKELKINERSLQAYTDQYIKNYECIRSEDDFINEEVEDVVLDCDVTCEECRERVVGKRAQYLDPGCDPCLSEEEYNQLLKDCELACSTEPAECSSALDAMRGDMSPFGQYGQFLKQDNGKLIVDASVYPLSIYNESSTRRLPVKEEWASEEKFVGPGWRTPFNPERTGAARYLYLNENGTEALVEIVQTGTVMNGTEQVPVFDPPITNRDSIRAHPRLPGRLGINPRYLASVKDFIDAWRPEWGMSLVAYHPEYCYYEFCAGNQNSHNWDRNLLNTKTYNEAVSQGLISNSARPNPVSDAVGDPFFRTTNPFNDNLHTLARTAIQYDVNNFIVSTKANKTYTLWQMAFVNTFCPQTGLEQSLCPPDAACPKENADIDFTSYGTNEELWSQFKLLYLALKKKHYQQRATYYAINHTCYNGCIGDSTFTPYKDNFIRFRKTVTLPWFWGDINFSFSEYYNPEQPCYNGRYALFKDKVARFPNMNHAMKGKDYTELCSTDAEGLYKPFTCEKNSEAILDELNNENDFKRYEECRQCPVTRDLEFFLDVVVKSPIHELSTSQFNLTCFPGGYVQYTPLMAERMNFSGTSQVVWKNISNANDELVSEFRQIDGNACRISFAFNEPHLGFIFDSIQSISNVQATNSPVHFPLSPGKNFFFKAKIANAFPPGSPQRVEKEFVLEGVTECMDLATCPPPVLCTTFGAASGIESLLNTLMLNINTPDFVKPNHLTSSNVNLELSPYKEFISPSLRAEGPVGNGWTWTGTASGKLLNGVITDNLSNSCQIELTIPDNENFAFSEIVRLINIKVDRDSGTPGSNFVVSAIIKDASGVLRATELKGFTSCVNIGACRTAVIKNQ